MSGAEVAASQAVAQHGAPAFDPGTSILHHVLDAHELEIPIPFLNRPEYAIHLPRIELFGLDLSITRHVVMMWIASLALLVIFRLAARRLANPLPGRLRGAIEVLLEFIRGVARRSIPHEGDRYASYLLTTFFFILACNLLGLIPGMSTATGNISVTAGLALVAFVMIQASGIRQYGVVRHFQNLLPHGLPLALVPLMLLLELLSMFVRPFALCIRLFANMMAGHVVILAFISLIFIISPIVAPISVGFALSVHFLELLVAFLQAYIFTMLTATFIGMSVHPAH
jgi:F-type H+-transporting ATPase subunit a